MNYLAKLRAEKLKVKLGGNKDIIIRQIIVNNNSAYLIMLEGLSNIEMANESIIKPLLMLGKEQKSLNLNIIKNSLTSVCIINEVAEEEFVNEIFLGRALLLINGEKMALSFSITKIEKRQVGEPPTAAVIKGPREGFTESNQTNIALLRKRLLTSSLRIDDIIIGKRTRTDIKIVYLVDVAEKSIVEKIKNKLQKIDIDGIIDSYYIIKFLEERPYSVFKQIGSAEKPDIIAAKVLEGRVAIFVDGSPIVLTIPYLFIEDIQYSNDYYMEPHRAMVLRFLSLIGLLISIIIPGFYVALQLYHYKILPLKFLTTIINTTQNLPLNPFLEMVFVLILFEVLYEASIRMPKYVGMALSIVGALILGDTAVKAGLVSSPGVMIVALSSITVYITPDMSSIIFLLRFLFVILGGTLGFWGIMLGIFVLIVYLLDFSNYGTPYLAPFVPYVKEDQKDFMIKNPIIDMKQRPRSFVNKNKTRLKKKSKR